MPCPMGKGDLNNDYINNVVKCYQIELLMRNG